ncbi:hypothetical protein ABF230_003224 [Yersinia ruckeri]
MNSRVAGAIALAIIDDLKDNTFSFSGFPMIEITQEESNLFKVTLSFSVKNTIVLHQFQLSEDVALKAESIFKEKRVIREIYLTLFRKPWLSWNQKSVRFVDRRQKGQKCKNSAR